VAVMSDFAFIHIYCSQYILSCNCPVTVTVMGELPSLSRKFNCIGFRLLYSWYSAANDNHATLVKRDVQTDIDSHRLDEILKF